MLLVVRKRGGDIVNLALIVAGGSGKRMGSDIPKQFINIYDKPILVYTLENFQSHPQVDAIAVVSLEGWEKLVWAYAKQFQITKLKWVVPGGDTVQESIRNGVFYLEKICQPEDMVIIHDGIRPMLDKEVLSDVIVVCEKHGNAVSSMPYNEQVFLVDSDDSTVKYIPRETLRRVSTPQAYYYGVLDEKYHEAFEKEIGIYGSSYTNTMMADLGERLYFAAGSERNIKLTTSEDLALFKALLHEETVGKGGKL